MKAFTFFTIFTAVLSLGSCNLEYEPVATNTFAYELQGTWIPNDPEGLYTGSLLITRDRITITGYGEKQTPQGEDDTKRPFRDFTKGVSLKGYSEEGHFYIQDAGFLQNGIPYNYWEETSPSDYRRIRFLRFNFGGRTETLQKTD